ncbi:MAG: C40 family peptidase [Verrucomicrobia bacterium]|nr:C40 family peptidase [Verrucomicrobiota bacterium]MBS0646315.1 C40 family peptidase [Verrucomicrobiota bacterium]
MFSICQPVVDLRKKPEWVPCKDFSHQEQRDSQLLYAEPVHVVRREGEWCYVHALLQGHYPGWIHESELLALSKPYHPNLVVCSFQAKLDRTGMPLCYGTLLEGTPSGDVLLPNGQKDSLPASMVRCLPQNFNIPLLCQEARLFLDAPYLWGGCSSPAENKIQSVDCSGLVHLLYRAQALMLPRDAKDQVLKGYRVNKFLPADAIYLFKPQKPAHHVLLALDEQTCIESPRTGFKVRLLKLNQDFWLKAENLEVEGREPCHYVVKRFCNLPLNLSRAFV